MTTPRAPDGRFLKTECDDPNCDGVLQPDVTYGSPIWACDGLTHDRDDGPLRACDRTFDPLDEAERLQSQHRIPGVMAWRT